MIGAGTFFEKLEKHLVMERQGLNLADPVVCIVYFSIKGA